MKKTIMTIMIPMLICAIFVDGCTGLIGTEPVATPAPTPEYTATPTVTVTAAPTPVPTVTATVNPVTPVPGTAQTITPAPSSAPVYTMSCTFTHLETNSTDSTVTSINGSLTDISSGKSISGSVNGDTYQFPGLSAGHYDLVLDIQYTIYYSNGSTDDRNTRITDSFDVNGNVDQTYLLN